MPQPAFRDRLRTLSPWALIVLAGCASLSVIDFWRSLGPTSLPFVRGTLPNLVAVPTLAFGVLMIRFPQRTAFDGRALRLQTRWFWAAWACALVVTLSWEFLQRYGALVFDTNDIYATFAGAFAAVALYALLARRGFLSDGTS